MKIPFESHEMRWKWISCSGFFKKKDKHRVYERHLLIFIITMRKGFAIVITQLVFS